MLIVFVVFSFLLVFVLWYFSGVTDHEPASKMEGFFDRLELFQTSHRQIMIKKELKTMATSFTGAVNIFEVSIGYIAHYKMVQ